MKVLQDQEDRIDDAILKCVEHFHSYGAGFGMIVRWVLPRAPAPAMVRLIRDRIQWLAKHGFIHHGGTVGSGTRWVIAGKDS